MGQKQHFASHPCPISYSTPKSQSTGFLQFFPPTLPSYTQIPESMQRVFQGLEVVLGPPTPKILGSVGENATTQHVPPCPLTLGWTEP